MGLWDKIPWSWECWEPNNQHHCGPSIPALKTMSIDSGSLLVLSTMQTEDYQSTCSQYCLHTASILKKKFGGPFSTQALQQPSGSWCLPHLPSAEPSCPWTWDCQGTECSLSYSVPKEAHFQKVWRWWIHPSELIVKPWRPSLPGAALNCMAWAPHLSRVYLELSMEQNWTFQTERNAKCLGLVFKG